MIRLVYASSATSRLTDAELDALLETSRRRNLESGVTGMLLYRDGDFLQVLEGDDAAVRETYARIVRDRRHGSAILLDESQITEREFEGWAMGFRRVATADAPEGFTDYLRATDQPSDGHAARMLAIFRELGR